MSFGKKIAAVNAAGLALWLADRLLRRLSVFYSDSGAGRKFFQFRRNYDLALSLPLDGKIIISLTVIILPLLVFFLLRAYVRKDMMRIVALTAVILGAASNLLDRLQYGYVVDYLNVPFFTVFNLADMLIVGGLGLLAIKELGIFKK